MNKRLVDIIKINSRFCRSINIYQDFNNKDILLGYICPSSSEDILLNIAENIESTQQAAFTWTGPYGSGKSSLALLLSALIGKNLNLREIASNIISKTVKNKFYEKISVTSKGWEVFPIIGDVKDPKELIVKYMKDKNYKVTDDFFKDLKHIAEKNDGLLIVMDEMGKCLENIVKNNGDVYFFQKMAEFVSRSNGRIIFIGILHQGFSEYANKLPYVIRDEWIKIQGRFIDMPVNTAGEEQIDLISKSINLTENIKFDSKFIDDIVENISQNKNLISSKSLTKSLLNCWPINPVVVCLLAQLSRKRFGQNQRSVFSFLNSGEPRAFKDFIQHTEYTEKSLYMPSDFFDYLKLNLETAIISSSDSKIWNVSMENIMRCQTKGADENHLNVLKTIALIDLFGSASGLNSSKKLLNCLYPNIKVDKILQDLESWSVITFKKYTQSYSIYEGSDFDIESALREASGNIDSLNFSKLLEIANFKPIVAKRHYHEFGCMRWFDVVFANVNNYEFMLNDNYRKSNSVGFFVVLLPSIVEEEQITKRIITQKHNFEFPVVFTYANNTTMILDYLKELLEFEWILQNKTELNGDRVAKREIESRKNIIISLLEIQLNKILSTSYWYYNSERIGLANWENLSTIASNICDNVFNKSPKIISELINRTKPSSSANTVINTLLKSMVLNEGKESLGLKETGPERSLYNILLEDTGIYQKVKKQWTFVDPKKNNLNLLWKETDDFLKSKNTALDLNEIYEYWNKSPFGIKRGLDSFLIISYLLTRKNKIAVYNDGIYKPVMDDLLVDYILKVKNISVKFIESEDYSDRFLPLIVQVLNKIQPQFPILEKASSLDISRKLVDIVFKLPKWVLKTKVLSKDTIKIREVIKSANDPNRLLFEDLEKVFVDNASAEDKYFQIVKGLEKSLKELVEVYPNLMKDVALLITSELGITLATPEKLEELRARAKNIKDVSGNFKINAFASRISTFDSKFDDVAGIISLANGKPPHEWIDLDIENAKKEILILCTEFKKTELYTKIKNRPSSRQGIAFITGIGGSTDVIEGDFDVLNSDRNQVDNIKQQLQSIITDVKNRNVLLTALTELTIENLKEGQND